MKNRIPIEFYEKAKEVLIYDPTSPSCLRWKNGKKAGSQDKDGYWLVRIGARPGKLLKAHRVVWFLHHGTLPDLIDHRDAITSNNVVKNLREANEIQNHANSKKHKDNSSGVKGISWDKRTNSWIAKCCLNYKQYTIGRFKDLDAAIEALVAKRNELHKEFARHD